MAWGFATPGWKVTKDRLTSDAKPKEGMTLIVAASDSNDTTRADYICDGTADEIEINQALNALPSVGGTVMLLEGTYNITASITIPNDDISFIGNGRATKIVTTQDIIMITASNVKGVKISNLYLNGIVGIEDVTRNNYGVYFDTVTNSKISDVQVLKTWNYSFYLYYCSNCRIIRCQTLGTERGSIGGGNVVGLAIQLNNTDNSEIMFCHIDGNNGGTGGIWLAYSDNNLIMGNHILYPGSDDAIYSAYGNKNRIIGNYIKDDDSNSGIRIDDENRCMICNNIIEDPKRGIWITNAACNNTLVTDNIIISAATAAITDGGTNTLPNGAVGTTNLQLDDQNVIA